MDDLRFVMAGVPVQVGAEILGEDEGNELSVNGGSGPIVADGLPEVCAQHFDKGFTHFRLVEQIGDLITDLANREKSRQLIFGQRSVELSIDIPLLRHGDQVANHTDEASHVRGDLVVNVGFHILGK